MGVHKMKTVGSPEFHEAVMRANEDHARYGDIDSGDWEENGALRVAGVARSDMIYFLKSFLDLFDNENDLRNPNDGERASTLLGIIEIAVTTGVHLERARWESING
jgi:hypothetical protein